MWAIEFILFGYFALTVLHVFVFSIAALFRKDPAVQAYKKAYNKIAILVPAYKEDHVIVHTAQELLKLNYPTESFDVVVIGDSLKPSTLDTLRKLPLKLIEVQFEKSTKANSLNLALHTLKKPYDVAIISDADNIMQKDFLVHINNAYNSGAQAIQGRRVAKNLNTPFAVLDAINEIINNHIFRKGFNALGLSSALIGSGMAFSYKTLKTFLSEINAVGGFDKELQLLFIENGVKIHYLESAIVFDEKIESSSSFEHQRRRWLSSQFIYLKKYFWKGCRLLFRGSFSYFNLAVLSNLFLSRSLALGLMAMIILFISIIPISFNIPNVYWYLLLSLYVFSLIIPIPIKFYNKKLLTALMKLPYAFYLMLKSLFKLKGANKEFIHTKHTRTEIDQSIFYSK